MSKQEIRETLEEQLGIIAERSKINPGCDLPELTNAMISLSAMILAFE